ncbi:MAG: hypothetical protein RIR18_28 [Pseudomonadota bacterium]|jgi:hypothetical protein
MTLLEQIEDCWNGNDAEKRTGTWATKLKANKVKLTQAIKQFKQWEPLGVYTSVTRGMRPNVTFSLRFHGQEVAELAVKDTDVRLNVSKKTAGANSSWFGISPELQGSWDWRGAEATEFRRQFKKASPVKFKSEEKRIEAAIIRELLGDSNKFAGTLKHATPVLFAECPFQFPLPISGHKGFPEVNNGGNGNIDILTKRGVGGASKLSVWELKAPGAEKTHFPIEQAYIYTVTLLKMLRSPCGDIWHKDVLGYERALPEKLTIESVAVVCPKNEKDKHLFLNKFNQFKKDNCLTVGNDEVVPMVAFYQPDTLSIELVQ